MPERRRERKVVTVVFADLVGFTSRAEALDPEDVEAILRPYHERLRAELERHGGTVEKFIGDAVMSVFGAPVVHEDDAERAVRAALAIRDGIVDDGTLEVRVGVHTGEALVNLDARPDAGEGMVAGDVVNTAARLQSAAPANGILVGEGTFRATERAIEYGEHAPVDAKGKAEPVRVWEAIQARSRLEVDVQQPRAPLVGRDRELDVLVDALDRVRSDRATQLVTLVGEPGIGKSRLVYELFQAVEADPELIWWRHGRSLPYGEGVSFWALGQMVKTQAAILETDPPGTAEEKLRVAVQEMDEADWLFSHLRPLVGLGQGGQADSQRSEAFGAWRKFFEELAEQRPLVLAFEDLHWADEGLLDFVDYLVDWASGVPILVVASARPELLERRPGWGGGKRNAVTISLAPLAGDDTARLLAALLERAVLPAETQANLLQRAGGNPLYAEEFARMLAERGGTEALPETLQGIISARLDMLAADEKALVQQASVVGKTFWLGPLQATSEHGLEDLLHALQRKEFVRRERRSSVEGDTEYAFLHVLIRDVAYAQIPRAVRARHHLEVAQWIEALGRPEDTAEMLAHHYLAALEYQPALVTDEPAVLERALHALGEAGARALSLSAYEACERFTDTALELVEPGTAEWSRLLVLRLRAGWHSRVLTAEEVARGEEACAELERAGFFEAAGEAGALAAWSAWIRGDLAHAAATIRHAQELVEDLPPCRTRVAVLNELARQSVLAGRDSEAAEISETALAMATELGLVDLQITALNHRGIARSDLGDPEYEVDFERCIELSGEIGFGQGIVRGYGNYGSHVYAMGNLARAFELHEGALAAAERFGIDSGIRWQLAERVAFDYHAGHWDDAWRGVDELLTEYEGRPRHFMDPLLQMLRALILAARGDPAAALAEDDVQVELSRDLDPQSLYPSLSYSAFLHALADERETAVERLENLLRLWRDGQNVMFDSSEVGFAAALLGREADFLAVTNTVRPTRWLEAARTFARGDPVQAAELFSEIGSRPNEAYSRLAAADEANVRRALDFYRSVGAQFYVVRAEALLPASA
jgi:class 3 adenylate cyclase/tetratricopeptide (TPR) repeat protein